MLVRDKSFEINICGLTQGTDNDLGGVRGSQLA